MVSISILLPSMLLFIWMEYACCLFIGFFAVLVLNPLYFDICSTPLFVDISPSNPLNYSKFVLLNSGLSHLTMVKADQECYCKRDYRDQVGARQE